MTVHWVFFVSFHVSITLSPLLSSELSVYSFSPAIDPLTIMELEKASNLKSWFTKDQRPSFPFFKFAKPKTAAASTSTPTRAISLPSISIDPDNSLPKLRPLAISVESLAGFHSPLEEDYVFDRELENQQFACVELTLSGNETLELKVPKVVSSACEFIKNNPPVEGIFRISGSLRKAKELEAVLSTEPDTAFELLDLDTFDAATVLKRFITRVSLPIIPMSLQQKLQVIELGNWKGYAETLATMDTIQLHLLLYLLEFFNSMLQPEVVAITKMNGRNVAKIFQVVFFQPGQCSSSEDIMLRFQNNELILLSLIGSIEEFKAYICRENAFKKEQEMLTLPGTPLPFTYSPSDDFQETTIILPKRLSTLLPSSVSCSHCTAAKNSLPTSMEIPSPSPISDSPSSISSSTFSTSTRTTTATRNSEIFQMSPSSLNSPSDRGAPPLSTSSRRRLSFAKFRLPSR